MGSGRPCNSLLACQAVGQRSTLSTPRWILQGPRTRKTDVHFSSSPAATGLRRPEVEMQEPLRAGLYEKLQPLQESSPLGIQEERPTQENKPLASFC
ncbi:MAG: hypothetical protein CSB23_00290 [Deltaproteobacteria bacterium]|nr:MAG: hypothetical protein CSB23_00290 [Deltaproteobacteria bacterium]